MATKETISRREFLKISGFLPVGLAFERVLNNEVPLNNEVSFKKERPYDPEQVILVIEHHNPNYGVRNDKKGPVYMTPALFESQLAFLKEGGYSTPTREEILGVREKKQGLPRKNIIIRMDIGVPTKDYEVSFKLLKKYGYSTLLFILPLVIPEDESETKVGWDTIKRYYQEGVIVPGSHGTAHPDYKNLTPSEAVTDALYSKRVIEEKLGTAVDFFAYPYDSAAHEETLLTHFNILFGRFNGYGGLAKEINLLGTYYPYATKDGFDWQAFEEFLTLVGKDFVKPQIRSRKNLNQLNIFPK